MKNVCFFIGALAILNLPQLAMSNPPQYEISIIQPTGNGIEITLDAINNSGQVAGRQKNSDGSVVGFIYSAGTMTFTGSVTHPSDINNSGQVTGTTSGTHGAIWTNGSEVDLGYRLFPTAINSQGDVAGYTYSSQDSFFYDGSSLTYLHDVVGSPCAANGMNDSGQIVGYTSTPSSSNWRAFLYQDGSVTYLPSLRGGSTIAEDINNDGLVVGRSDVSGQYVAFSWNQQNGIKNLGSLPGHVGSSAGAVNNLGQIVGTSSTLNLDSDVFLYTDGTMYNLKSIAVNGNQWVRLTSANDINDSGQIVGVGQLYNNNVLTTCYFVTSPVPEPATISLLAFGGLLIIKRKRK